MCSYHGWRFSSSGGCVRIPQADSPEAQATACASKRSCAASFPVKVGGWGAWVSCWRCCWWWRCWLWGGDLRS